MITFRKKSQEDNLIPDAIRHLEEEGLDFTVIKSKEADKVSKQNSSTMVLMDFRKNQDGFYQITVKDKMLYAYNRKLLETYCSMRILSENKSARTLTAETSKYGIALDILELLATKYNFYIVEDGNV